MRVGGDADDRAGGRSQFGTLAAERPLRALRKGLPNTFTVPYISSASRRLTISVHLSPSLKTRPERIGIRITPKYSGSTFCDSTFTFGALRRSGLEDPPAERRRRDDRGTLDFRIRRRRVP